MTWWQVALIAGISTPVYLLWGLFTADALDLKARVSKPVIGLAVLTWPAVLTIGTFGYTGVQVFRNVFGTDQ